MQILKHFNNLKQNHQIFLLSQRSKWNDSKISFRPNLGQGALTAACSKVGGRLQWHVERQRIPTASSFCLHKELPRHFFLFSPILLQPTTTLALVSPESPHLIFEWAERCRTIKFSTPQTQLCLHNVGSNPMFLEEYSQFNTICYFIF